MSMSESARGKAIGSNNAGNKEFVCPTCGNEYDTQHGLSTHRGQYCDGVTGVQYTCDWCDSEDTKRPSQYDENGRNFCGRKCWAEWNAQHQENKVPYECDYCGESFQIHPFRLEQADKHFCPNSRCYSDYQSENCVGEESRAWKGGYGRRYGAEWKKIRTKILQRDDHKCQWCAKSENELEMPLEVHHIKPLREFDSLKNAHDSDNLVALCKSCHARWEGIPLRPQLIQ